uniref:Hepatocyte growth factor-regulated tyrosine kinase substrate n=1 Tax=Hydra vulgaris TaxID=6087 RepID=T2MIM2_HYDVU
MSSLFAASGKSRFDKLLESATSQMLLEPNWATNLEICDSIRQKDVTPAYAVKKIRSQIQDANPHISIYALVVMETCVKNCGQPFHEEINNHEFMSELKQLAQTGTAPVKEQILTMIQAWNHVFRNKPQFQPILATYNLLKMEGVKFPELKESDAMFTADHAPEWKEGDVCNLCRTKFSMLTRQHHCRACGEVFCNKCSSKTSIIPKIGMEREVRVCDTCFDEINPNTGKEIKNPKKEDNGLPEEYLKSDLYKEEQRKTQTSQSLSQEEEELQLALALSLSEEQSSKSVSSRGWSTPQQSYTAPSNNYLSNEKISANISKSSESKPSLYSKAVTSLQEVSSNQPELELYMDRSYWEKKKAEIQSSTPSAPSAISSDQTNDLTREYADDSEEVSENATVFYETMDKSIAMFVNRMTEVSSKGKHIAMDPTVQSLFSSLTAMHPQLLNLIEDQEESQNNYEAMLTKLSVIREARESLNDMRAQYVEKTRQQELEQEMLRRMQMEQKLELMRQQKQEYLEYQHVLQLQRQQELEMYQQQKLRERLTQNYDGYSVGTVPSQQPQGYSVGTVPSQQPQGYSVGTVPSQQLQGYSVGTVPSQQPQGYSVGPVSSQQPQVYPVGSVPSQHPQGVYIQPQNFNPSLESQNKTKFVTSPSSIDYDNTSQSGNRIKKIDQPNNNLPNPEVSSLQYVPQLPYQNISQNTALPQKFVAQPFSPLPQSMPEYNVNITPPPPYEQSLKMGAQHAYQREPLKDDFYQKKAEDESNSLNLIKGNSVQQGVYRNEQFAPNQTAPQPILNSAYVLQSQQDPQSKVLYSSDNQNYSQISSDQGLYKQTYLPELQLQLNNQALYQQQQLQQPFSHQQQPFVQQSPFIHQQQFTQQPVTQPTEPQQNQPQSYQQQFPQYKQQQQKQEPLAQNQFTQHQQLQYQQPQSATQNGYGYQPNGFLQQKQQYGYAPNIPPQELNPSMKDLQLISFD